MAEPAVMHSLAQWQIRLAIVCIDCSTAGLLFNCFGQQFKKKYLADPQQQRLIIKVCAFETNYFDAGSSMTKSPRFHHFYKEIGRFSARDEKGNHHTVVERIKINQKTDTSGKLISSRMGSPQFYSATTGDVLIRGTDGNLADQNNTYCVFPNLSQIKFKLASQT